MEAKEKIPVIQQHIQNAESQTVTNRATLDVAKAAASKALGDAEEAKTIADKASEVIQFSPFFKKVD